jgi:hypothetical protein
MFTAMGSASKGNIISMPLRRVKRRVREGRGRGMEVEGVIDWVEVVEG